MELKTAIMNRHSTRKFKYEQIPDESIREIIDGARMAPSGKNIQNWHYIAIKTKSVKEELYNVIEEKNNYVADKLNAVDSELSTKFRKTFKYATSFFVNAPVVFLVFSTDYIPGGVMELDLINHHQDEIDRLKSISPGMQSLGASINTLMLKATEMGYGTCWMTSANYAGKEIEEYVKSKIGFAKEGYYFSAMVVMGVAERETKSPKKKTVDEILTIA